MIVKPYELDKIKNDLKFFLFYGKNEGLKNQHIKQLLEKNNKSNVTKYDEKEILENEDIFFESILSNSLFENEKSIVINRGTDKINDIVIDLIERNIDGITIIITANVLEKKSKLRKLFEKGKNLACIATYLDTNEILSNLALAFFKKIKISISQQNINLIVDKCGGDRLNLENELEKIKIYSTKKKNISSEEISKLINLSENHTFYELIDNCLAKNANKTLNILNENNFSNEDCMIILRTFLLKAKKILNLSIEYEKNKDINQTINSAKPPIFWKEKDIVKTQLNKWTPEKIRELIYLINDIELQIKKNYNNSILLVTDFILNQEYTKTNN
ncbi:DNA polymerase III subunit delta [Candidatus Pelagibacter sp.]|nr:DNA polymerase III subunit delta [Candidatus Pelagibacter sp.]